MFNKNFYPTPASVIIKMIDAIGGIKEIAGSTILEPSAGKGDIIKYIIGRTSRYKRKILCFEVEPELQSILCSIDECRLIGGDFLTEPCNYKVDYIIMNPPFDKGAEHLLRAWNTIENGKIVCLLNAETVNNPHTKERNLLSEIIKENGTIEYLGNCFASAERKTAVEVAMIVLEKKSVVNFDFTTDSFDKNNIDIPEDISNSSELELTDPLQNREHRYNSALENFKLAMIYYQKFKKDAESLFTYSIGKDETGKDNLYTPPFDFSKQVDSNDFNSFLEDFNGRCWEAVLRISKFETYLTKKVQNDFLERFKNQKNVGFTKDNMMQMFSILFQNKESILDNCLLEVFDIFTKYHDENRQHIEGWKTNDKFKVNMKVILPNYLAFGKYAHDLKNVGGKFEILWQRDSELNDIDRAMCYLTGLKFENIETVESVLKTRFKEIGYVKTGDNVYSECESSFFKIKFFKKGTLHITFKDKLLWQWFNCRVCELRGYPLPEAKEVKNKFNNKLFVKN